jgi:4-amino-4-deoxy-L-arabinose transferase-like glycosyltransferase
MKLIDIDKQRYRRHLNWVFAGIVAALVVISIGSSAILIQLFSTPGQSNFWLNLAGVVIAAAVVAAVLVKLRPHPFMQEVVYIWDLKQMLNRIYRKQSRLEAAVESGDPDALVIMNFFYRGSKQLYEMDDNLVTMDSLIDKIRVHDRRLANAGLTIDADNFDPARLDRFD